MVMAILREKMPGMSENASSRRTEDPAQEGERGPDVTVPSERPSDTSIWRSTPPLLGMNPHRDPHADGHACQMAGIRGRGLEPGSGALLRASCAEGAMVNLPDCLSRSLTRSSFCNRDVRPHLRLHRPSTRPASNQIPILNPTVIAPSRRAPRIISSR